MTDKEEGAMKRIIDIDATTWKCPDCGTEHEEAFPYESDIQGQTVKCSKCRVELLVTEPIPQTPLQQVREALEECKGNLCYNHSTGFNNTECTGRTFSCDVMDDIDLALQFIIKWQKTHVIVRRDRLQSQYECARETDVTTTFRTYNEWLAYLTKEDSDE